MGTRGANIGLHRDEIAQGIANPPVQPSLMTTGYPKPIASIGPRQTEPAQCERTHTHAHNHTLARV